MLLTRTNADGKSFDILTNATKKECYDKVNDLIEQYEKNGIMLVDESSFTFEFATKEKGWYCVLIIVKARLTKVSQ
jgi:hypothetical protein